MKKHFAAIAIVAGLAAGCATDKKPLTADMSASSALDVNSPAPAAPMPMPLATATPVPSQSIGAPDTVAMQTTTPEVGSSAGGSSYTVKKGDTLYKLAREHYGDGKQWQRIVSANPGITPQSLKVGQTLIIP